MSDQCLPPEISDYIVDLLYDDPETLKRCCLVSKPWVPRARKHLFGKIRFEFSNILDAWREAFPDPANSPAYHTHSLLVGHIDVAAVDVEEGGWVWEFRNVVRLQIWTGMRNLHLHSHRRPLTGSQISPHSPHNLSPPTLESLHTCSCPAPSRGPGDNDLRDMQRL
jgi:hypothetical protein